MSIGGKLSGDLVSVIIPTYNRAALVVQAIESVRAQTWKNVQIIVVDDQSTDDTEHILGSMKDIVYLRQVHSGQAAARNLGLSHAIGNFVCTLDSDDFWHPDFLTRSIEAIKNLGANMVFANWISSDSSREYQSYFENFYRWWDFAVSDFQGWRVMHPYQSRAMFLDSCACPSSAILFRRETLCHGWTEHLNIGDDWCLILDAVLTKPFTIAFTMDRLWTKRVVGDNIYDQRDPVEVHKKLLFEDAWLMYDRHVSLLTLKERGKLARRLARASARMAKIEWKHGHKLKSVFALCQTARAIAHASVSTPGDVFKRLVLRTGDSDNSPLPAVPEFCSIT